ncbi:MAG: EF-hand domain-containing protein [Planctomycetes bacterium]|nr:EF-hand domain-containing protein [Planctomycetota bacterium]
MRHFGKLCGLIAFAMLSFSVASSQDGGDFKKRKKDKGAESEDTRLFKMLEKASKGKKNETERDKVIKELLKLRPDEPLVDDFSSWFDRVATSRNEWDRNGIERKPVGEIFDRMAWRLEIKGEKISRAEFLRYAQTFWRADQSPLWKEPKEFDPSREAEKMFKHLDRNGDGVLSVDEMPETLRRDLRRWDKDGDGVISFAEYRDYFPHRLQQIQRDFAKGEPATLEIRNGNLDERPQVMRGGKLPPGLPAWFEQLDTNADGQVALYEWRRAGWPIEEFEILDLNDDGLVTPDEVLKVLAVMDRDGRRPYAYFADKKVTTLLRTNKSAK